MVSSSTSEPVPEVMGKGTSSAWTPSLAATLRRRGRQAGGVIGSFPPATREESEPLPRSTGRGEDEEEDEEREDDTHLDDVLQWNEAEDAGLRDDERTSRRGKSREGSEEIWACIVCCLFLLAIFAGCTLLVLWKVELLDDDVRQAAKSGDVETITFKLDTNWSSQVNAQGFDRMTALHWATIKERTNVMTALLDRRADTTLTGSNGLTALHYAARNGHTEAANILLTYNHTVDPRDAGGRTPLQWAALYGHANMVTLLLGAGADPLATNNDRYHSTAKQLAENNRHRAIEKILGTAESEARAERESEAESQGS